ncbi:thiamine pyrophosphate-binding protein [Kitasatospora sp. NPDC056273]|uniref:thiamine pyrophosphate-binding protein n=1 Tax=Kitasatospora sp. NPDC056273 TaxID=3345769 RepID=UPI0035DA0042
MSAVAAYEALVEAGVEIVYAVPDSLLAPLCREASARREIRYVQVNDEATAVGLAAGARLAGARSLVVMENSGLRRACETLARLTMSHRLHTALLMSRRGAFGEPNWWGIPHEETMHRHTAMLSLVTADVHSCAELAESLRKAYATLDTGQRSVALVANAGMTAELRGAP